MYLNPTSINIYFMPISIPNCNLNFFLKNLPIFSHIMRGIKTRACAPNHKRDSQRQPQLQHRQPRWGGGIVQMRRWPNPVSSHWVWLLRGQLHSTWDNVRWISRLYDQDWWKYHALHQRSTYCHSADKFNSNIFYQKSECLYCTRGELIYFLVRGVRHISV